MLRMIIKKRIVSQNKRDKMHWAQKSKDRDDWASRICVMVYQTGAQEYLRPKGKRLVRVVSYRKRLCDIANLIGGAKGLIDALTRSRLIVDDSPQWMDATYVQHKVSESPAKGARGAGEECTVIEIKDECEP